MKNKFLSKLMASVVSFVMTVSILQFSLPDSVSADDGYLSDGTFCYTVTDNKATIIGLVDADYKGALTIPDTLGGVPCYSYWRQCILVLQRVNLSHYTKQRNYYWGVCIFRMHGLNLDYYT